MLRAVSGALVALGLLASLAGAEESYTLQLYKSKKGDKSEHEKNETTKTSFSFVGGGKNTSEESTSGNREAFTEVILEKKDGDRRPTKLTRAYTVAEKTAMGETTRAVYAGKTVLIEKKVDTCELSIKGKALKESVAKELYRKFNKNDDDPHDQELLSEEPVKVGGTWTVPAAKSARMFTTIADDKMKINATRSTVSGKLLKVYKKDGAQFGTIEMTITVFVTEIDLGGQLVKTAGASKMVFKSTHDTCIDGTVEFGDSRKEGALDITAAIPNVGSVTIKSTMTGTEKIRAAKK